MLYKIARVYRTIKYLKPIQIYGLLRTRLLPKNIIFRSQYLSAPSHFQIRKPHASLQPTPPKKDYLTLDPENHQLSLTTLNQTFSIHATNIWHDLKDTSKSRLWLYHLHYFHYLHAAQPLTHTITLMQNLILRWIAENPIAAKPGWEPYPTSLRIVNWIKWLLQEVNHCNPLHVKCMHASLLAQTRWLSANIEIHLSANHLLANAKALIFAGLYFQEKRTLLRGMRIMQRELASQILADGGHYELSPMYHAIILEDLLDIINICRAYEEYFPRDWETKAARMLHWLRQMCHPDGELAFFNDTTHGVAATLSELENYAKQLQLKDMESSPVHLQTYTTFKHDNMTLIADTSVIGARNQPGHAHADTLSFELSIDQRRVFVNSGISTYHEDARRLHERSTCAHNTLSLNGENSSEVWKSFRVGRRANLIARDINQETKCILATHNGYQQPFGILHRRQWQFIDNTLCIHDELISSRQTRNRKYLITLYFHLHPHIHVQMLTQQHFILSDNTKRVLATLITDRPAVIADSLYHVGFNASQVNKKIVITSIDQAPTHFTTLLINETTTTISSRTEH